MGVQQKIQITNKRARFEYEFLEEAEAGIVLTGTEIKSIRDHHAHISEAFCEFIGDELYIINMSIEEYKLGTYYNHSVRRQRKLLMHRRELNQWRKKVTTAGVTIVPVRLYLNEKGKVKIRIALAKGKKLYDKRESIKEREVKRNLARVLKKS